MSAHRRTQAERTESTRTALVRAAIAVIAQRGYAAASLGEIAAAAGVSKGALTHHFRAREELLPEVANACAAALEATIARAVAGEARAGARPRSIVRALLAVHRGTGGAEARAMLELVLLAGRDSAARGPVAESAARVATALGAAMTDALGAAGLRSRVAPEVLPGLVLAVIEGVAVRRAAGSDGARSEAVEAAAEELLLGLFGP